MTSTYTFLTLFYINYCLTSSLLPSSFIVFYLSSYIRRRLSVESACVFYFVTLTSSCWLIPWQGEAEEKGTAGKERGNKREYTLTRQSEGEEVGIAGKGTGNKREWTLIWQGEAEEEGIAGEGDENAAGVVQEAGLKNPAQWPSALSGAGHTGRLFGACAGQLFDAGQLTGAGQLFDVGQLFGACAVQVF